MSRFGAVVRHRGPFVTAHFDASHDTEDAASAIQLRWRGISDQLGAYEAGAATLRALDDAVDERRPGHGKVGRYLVGAEGTVLLDEYLPDPPAQSIAEVGPVPNLLPLLTLEALTVPHVVAVIDRVGADLFGLGAHSARSRTVDGRTHPVHKVRAAGFAHYSIQHHVEEMVKDNLSTVAAETAELAREVDAEVLVLAGEVQARAEVKTLLPKAAKDIAVEVPGGSRSGGTDPDTLQDEVRAALRKVADAHRRDAAAKFGRERHGDGRSATGLWAVAAALRESAVDTLFLDAKSLPHRHMWVGYGPEQIAFDAGDVGVAADDRSRRTTAVTALLSACAATGASAILLDEPGPDDPAGPDGIAALLRYPANVATAHRPT